MHHEYRVGNTGVILQQATLTEMKFHTWFERERKTVSLLVCKERVL